MIGFAGDDDKVKWLTEELNFDSAFNYKKVNLDETFKQFVPQKIDCYFDNVNVFRNLISKYHCGNL